MTLQPAFLHIVSLLCRGLMFKLTLFKRTVPVLHPDLHLLSCTHTLTVTALIVTHIPVARPG